MVRHVCRAAQASRRIFMGTRVYQRVLHLLQHSMEQHVGVGALVLLHTLMQAHMHVQLYAQVQPSIILGMVHSV